MGEPGRSHRKRVTRLKAQRAIGALKDLVMTDDVKPGSEDFRAIEAACVVIARLRDEAVR